MLKQKTKRIPAYRIIGRSAEKRKIGTSNILFCEWTNDSNKNTRSKRHPINKGSDINPENVSIITGEKAKRADATIPEKIFLEALNPNCPTIIVHTENNKILIHLTVKRKFPFMGVNKLNIKGKKGGNSVASVMELLEFRITVPIPAWILRAALR